MDNSLLLGMVRSLIGMLFQGSLGFFSYFYDGTACGFTIIQCFLFCFLYALYIWLSNYFLCVFGVLLWHRPLVRLLDFCTNNCETAVFVSVKISFRVIAFLPVCFLLSGL